MKSQLNIDVVQVSVDGIDEEGAPVSRSESFDAFDLGDSTADNSVFNPFGGAQESEKNPFNQSGRIVNTPTTLNIFRQPNLQIKVRLPNKKSRLPDGHLVRLPHGGVKAV